MTYNGRTWCDVNLSALAGNYRTLSARAGCGVIGVVKADAYGHGIIAVAQVLEKQGCPYLGVACADEAVTIRANELSLPDTEVAQDAPISLHVSATRCAEPILSDLKALLGQHPGPAPVRVVVVEPGRRTVVQAGHQIGVTKTPALYSDVKKLLGVHCLTSA